MKHSPGKRCQRGLTLVELLIAITLVALMTTVLLQALQLASGAWDARALPGERVMQASMVREWIRRELGQAQPMTVALEDGERMLAFTGESEGVSFVATVPAHLGGGGLYWIEFRAAGGEGDRRLTMTRELFHPDTVPGVPLDARILVEQIHSVRFEYFGSIAENEPPAWHDSWIEMDYLPSLVRLSVETSAASGRPWPAILAAPMIDGRRPAEYRAIGRMLAETDAG